MEPKITAKAWDPGLEPQILQEWQNGDIYRFEVSDDNYTIDTPPPYPSGRPWHIGAAAHYAQIDMIARTARMAGKNVYFPIGIDRNGLPVEIYTEKKHGIRMRETERGRFLELCREALDSLEVEMITIMTRLGISGDIKHHYRTDSDEYRALTQATFIDMWKQGRIILATRPNNYDWASGTTIADAEIAYQDMDTDLVHIRFDIDGTDGHIVIASTRPELLCACRAIIVNPDDDRYVQQIGKDAIVPLTGARVRIRGHHSARQDFGSGAVMVCSYGDQNDVALFREMGLEEVAAIGLDGRMTASAGPYVGLRPKQARKEIIGDLKDAGLVEGIEKISHRTPVSERSKTPIEIIPMEEYYILQKDSVDELRRIADTIRFHPPMHKQILLNWLDSISIDWPISRRRYYSTEIPIWYCKECREPHVPEPGRYYRPWMQESPIKACVKCGGAEFVGEERTFDTWMDSSITPLFISRYGSDEVFFDKVYPASIRPQAKDIVRTWLHYTLLRCSKITGRRPWSEAWIMGYGLDEHGLKMSKSKGNAIDPLPVIEKYGADTFRFWSASEVNHGYDFRCSKQKIESTKKFLSKLWNVARFLSGFPVIEDAVPAKTDRWILAELDTLIRECERGYAEYNFFVPAIAVREFVWNLFAPHYIEMVKGRAYGQGFTDGQRDAAIYTLHKVFSSILRLLAPIIPFITEHLWKTLYSGESIHVQMQVRPQGVEDLTGLTQEVVRINAEIWNKKKEAGISMKDPITADIPDSLAGFGDDLKAMHRLERL